MIHNTTIDTLMKRKSVRVFLDQEIEEEKVESILQASINAPTAGNQQLYTILNITDPTIKEQLSILCDNQPFIASAKLILIYLADCHKWYEAYKDIGLNPRQPEFGDFLLAVDDALIASENAVVAAESLGIGSCYIGDVMENKEEICKLLHLPDYVFPASLLVFGYPTKQQQERQKPQRASLNDIVFENRYYEMNAKEREGMLKYHYGDAKYHLWLEAFYKRKYDSSFAHEMNRSVKAYLKDYQEEKK